MPHISGLFNKCRFSNGSKGWDWQAPPPPPGALGSFSNGLLAGPGCGLGMVPVRCVPCAQVFAGVPWGLPQAPHAPRGGGDLRCVRRQLFRGHDAEWQGHEGALPGTIRQQACHLAGALPPSLLSPPPPSLPADLFAATEQQTCLLPPLNSGRFFSGHVPFFILTKKPSPFNRRRLASSTFPFLF